MTPGHSEEMEPLIPSRPYDSNSREKLLKVSTLAAIPIKDDSIHENKNGKHAPSLSNYGATNRLAFSPRDKITYTWTKIDVFGRVDQNLKGLQYYYKKLKNTCTRNVDPTLRKQILKNVTGVAYGGELLAIMGSSGAGKTTLLNALAFRKPANIDISSHAVRALNGHHIGTNTFRAHSAYVEQEDLFIGILTVAEHLIFQANLRMGSNIPKKQRCEKIEEVLEELGLRKCRNTMIGEPGRLKGISGGERKRLTLATEALTDPHILICDEPTSGLDSFIAYQVVHVLKQMAKKGKTIILTIHQPSSDFFNIFDKILLLAEGRTAFMGTPEEAIGFFGRLDRKCPVNYNPADFYIQTLAIIPGKSAECRDTVNRICDAYSVGPEAQKILAIASNYKDDRNNDFLVKSSMQTYYKASWWTQFYTILFRSVLTVLKEPVLLKVRFLQTVLVGLLVGLIFYGQEMNQEGVMNLNGAQFLCLTSLTFQNVFAVIDVFCNELPVFKREYQANLYRTDTYFLGKTLADVPLFTFIAILFISIIYPMIGLRWGWSFYLYACLINILVGNTATSFGYMLSTYSPNISIALSVGPPILIPFIIFGGFFLNSASIPWYLKWLSYLSWFKYGNEALVINQWNGVPTGAIKCSKPNSTECPSSGDVILQILNFDAADFNWDIIMLAFLIFFYRILAFLGLVLRSRNRE